MPRIFCSADELFAIMESSWGESIRNSLDPLLDMIVSKFIEHNQSAVMISWPEFRKAVESVPKFWNDIVRKAEMMLRASLRQSHQ